MTLHDVDHADENDGSDAVVNRLGPLGILYYKNTISIIRNPPPKKKKKKTVLMTMTTMMPTTGGSDHLPDRRGAYPSSCARQASSDL